MWVREVAEKGVATMHNLELYEAQAASYFNLLTRDANFLLAEDLKENFKV
jgi:hypothetical protein